MKRETNEPVYGIIRYAAGSGSRPDQDVAAFDGWYSDKEDANAVFLDWKQRFPRWIVVVVEQAGAHWGDGDYSHHRARALRENGMT